MNNIIQWNKNLFYVVTGFWIALKLKYEKCVLKKELLTDLISNTVDSAWSDHRPPNELKNDRPSGQVVKKTNINVKCWKTSGNKIHMEYLQTAARHFKPYRQVLLVHAYIIIFPEWMTKS